MRNPPKYALLFLIAAIKLIGVCVIGLALLIGGYATWILWSVELRVSRHSGVYPLSKAPAGENDL